MKTKSILTRVLPAFFLGVALTAVAAPGPTWAAIQTKAATPAETAAEARAKWAEAKKDYLAAVKPYAGKPEHAALLKQYDETLDKTGQALEQYISLKLASPPTPAAKITPVVDQLAKNLAALRKLQGKAGGELVTVLGGALSQHNQVVQNTLKNMR